MFKAMYVLTMGSAILDQIKQRRLQLGLKQSDMMLRIGVSRQQYQHLEAKGNPRLDTLDLVAQGLNSELMLIPKERVAAVKALLAQAEYESGSKQLPAESRGIIAVSQKTLIDDPWQGLLGDA